MSQEAGKQPKGSLREVMPATAAIVEEMRQAFGPAMVDRIVREAMAGRPTMYAAEMGRDGVLRVFGQAPSGRKAALQGGELVLLWEDKS